MASLGAGGAAGGGANYAAFAPCVRAAGLLHHFESKEQLLHAVLDARDADDLAAADFRGDTIEQLQKVVERFERSPESIGMFTVLLTENLNAEASLHERFLNRYRLSVDIIAKGIRRGQREGRYRPDLDPAVKAAEIVAFITGLETSWLLGPSIPLTEVFREYTSSLARRLTSSPPSEAPSSPG